MKYLITFCFILLFSCLSVQAQTNLYVDGSVAVSGNGTSWATPYKTLGAALTYVNNASTTTNYIIYVAKGTYYPTTLQSGTNRDSAFCIFRGGVKVYGGYPKGGGARNIAGNPTILSGNIGSTSDSTDNSYHVMVISNISNTGDSAVVDGFTITGGYANIKTTLAYNGVLCNRSYAGGIYNTTTNSKVKISNVTFTHNYARLGGAMCNISAAPVVTAATFNLNTAAAYGGAVYDSATTMYLYYSTLSNNKSCAIYFTTGQNSNFFLFVDSSSFNNNTGSNALPGAVYVNGGDLYDHSNLIANSTFTKNTGGKGGAVYTDNVVSSCTFTNNYCSGNGGALYVLGAYGYNGTGNVSGCTFSGNKAVGYGGGIYAIPVYSTASAFNYFPALTGCKLSNDTAAAGGGIYCYGGTITGCNVKLNVATYGGGITGNPYYTSSNFGFYSPVKISNCKILGNKATLNGGGCFMFNKPGADLGYSRYYINNTLIAGNYATQNGGGVYSQNFDLQTVITNVTMAGNNAVNGQALYDSSSSQVVLNSIIYDGATSVFNAFNSAPLITYSLVDGGYNGTGIINADPRFANSVAYTSAPDTAGNYNLISCSPAINTGHDSGTYTSVTDLAGNNRIYNGTVDMGAYEYQGAANNAGTIYGYTGSNLCINFPIQLSDFTTGGVWKSSNPSLATITNNGLLTGIATGTDTVTYTVGSGGSCEAVATVIFSVKTSPAVGVITGDTAFCSSSSTQFSETLNTGVWGTSNTNILNISGTGKATATASNGAVLVTYTVTGVNGCAVAATLPVIVYAVPNVDNYISGSTSVCAFATTTVSNIDKAGVWGSTNKNLATINSATGAVTGVSAGIDTITYTVTNVACSKTVSRPITVNAAPPVGDITGSDSICNKTSVKLVDLTGGGFWGSTQTSVASINSSGTVTAVGPGTDTITYYIVGFNNCKGTAYFPLLVSNAPTVSPITGDNSSCLNSPLQLGDTTHGGVWSSTNTAVANVNSNGLVTGVASGNATINYTLKNGGCSVSKSLAIAMHPALTVNATTGNDSVCQGSTVQLQNTTADGTWSSKQTSIATVNNAGLVTGHNAGTDTIVYTVSNLYNCEATSSKALKINAAPTVSAISGPASACVNQTVQLNDSTSAGTWASSNQNVATINNTGLVTTVGGGTSSISYTVTNNIGCAKTVTQTEQVNTINAAVTQSANTLTSAQATGSYQWVICPSYAAITGQTQKSYTATDDGQFAVIISYGGCVDTSTCYNVTLTAIENINAQPGLFTIYPNPTSSLFILESKDITGDTKMVIRNLLGQTVQQEMITSNKQSFELHAPAGNYFIEIQTAGKYTQVLKLTKQ